MELAEEAGGFEMKMDPALAEGLNRIWKMETIGNTKLEYTEVRALVYKLVDMAKEMKSLIKALNKIDDDWDKYEVENYYAEPKWYYWHRKLRKTEKNYEDCKKRVARMISIYEEGSMRWQDVNIDLLNFLVDKYLKMYNKRWGEFKEKREKQNENKTRNKRD